MSTIYTRASKGSALTWAEGDANITNLNNDKMENFTVAGDSGSSQTISGGNTLTISGGTNLNSVASATDTITVNLESSISGLTSVGSTAFTGTNFDASSSSGGHLRNSSGVDQLDWGSGGGSNLSLLVATNINPANAAVSIAPTGTGTVTVNPATAGTINNMAIGGTTAAAGKFTAVTTTSIVSESNGNISITPNGTGQTVVKNIEYNEFIHDLGTTSGTITPNVTNGNVQTITLNGNLTFSAFSSPIAGQSLTLIINTGGTSRTLTSTMKFSGGAKTMSATNTTDIMTVFYDGTNYWASYVTDWK